MDQLESELRQSFAQRAGALPPDAYARLRQVDYHPRSPVFRKSLALGGAAGAAGVAGIAIAVVGLGAGAQRAFAGWTASPTAAASGQVAAAEVTCKTNMATPAQRQQARTQAAGSDGTVSVGSSTEGGEWQTVLSDTRGPYTIVLLANSSGRASCLTGPGFTQPAIGADESPGSTPSVPAGQISDLSYGFSRTANEQPYMKVSGRVGSDVQAVTLILSDGSHVTASSADGWFLAWWPGAQKAVAAEITTGSGTNTLQLHDPVAGSLAG